MAQNLFAACKANDQLVTKRVHLNRGVQQAVEDTFTEQEAEFRRGITEEIPFDGSWKPEDNEVLTLPLPSDAQAFVTTIEANPVTIPDLDTSNFDRENIKALFTGTSDGDATTVLIQQFSGRQVLSRKFSLFQDGNAFRRLTNPAFTLDSSLACIVEKGKLKFKSFHKMRAIVDLSNVYREATDQELQNFAGEGTILMPEPANFVGSADQTIRKLVHAITRSGILAQHTPREIVDAAVSIGLHVATNSAGKITMPTARGEIKTLLQFLDDGLYRAALSGQRYVTNSKKPA